MEGEKIFKLSKSQKQLLEASEGSVQEIILKTQRIGKLWAMQLLAQFRSELFVPDGYTFDFSIMAFKPKETKKKEGENEKDS